MTADGWRRLAELVEQASRENVCKIGASTYSDGRHLDVDKLMTLLRDEATKHEAMTVIVSAGG